MGQEVSFDAKVKAFMEANPGVSRKDAEKAVREKEQAELTAGISGNANEGRVGEETSFTLKDGVKAAGTVAAGVGIGVGVAKLLNKVPLPGWAKEL